MSIIHYNHHMERDKTLPIWFFTACSEHSQERICRPNGSGFFHQIMIVVSGTGLLKRKDRIYELKRGCAFFTSQTTPVEYFGTKDLVTAFLTANGSAVEGLMSFYRCDGFLFYESVNIDKYVSDIDRITNHYYEHKQAGFLSGLVYTFYTDFFELQNKSLTKLDQVVLYIEKNFMKKLTLTRLAAIGCMSVSKLSHDFKSRFDCSVFQYILNLRLNYARTLLLSNPNATTKEIALSCGFDDVSYFCRAYKAKFGKSTTEEKEFFS